MRTRDAFLIVRAFTSAPVLGILALMILLGFGLQMCGLDKPKHPEDIVCIGAHEYDIGDKEDRSKILDDLVGWERTASQTLQRPPCDNLGSPAPQATIKKFYQLLDQDLKPAAQPSATP